MSGTSALTAQGGQSTAQPGLAGASAGETVPYSPSAMPVSAPGVTEVDLNDDIETSALQRVGKMAVGQKSRMALTCFKPDGGPRFLSQKTYYIEIGEESFSFVAPEHDPELNRACFRTIQQEPGVKIWTVVLVYDTDLKGTVLTPVWKLRALRLTPREVPQVKEMHREWGLGTHDFVAFCKEDRGTFGQVIDRVIAQQCYFREHPQIRVDLPTILAQSAMLFEDILPRLMARVLPDEHIRMLLNGQIPPSRSSVAPHAPGAGASSFAPAGAFAAMPAPAALPSLDGPSFSNPFAAAAAGPSSFTVAGTSGHRADAQPFGTAAFGSLRPMNPVVEQATPARAEQATPARDPAPAPRARHASKTLAGSPLSYHPPAGSASAFGDMVAARTQEMPATFAGAILAAAEGPPAGHPAEGPPAGHPAGGTPPDPSEDPVPF